MQKITFEQAKKIIADEFDKDNYLYEAYAGSIAKLLFIEQILNKGKIDFSKEEKRREIGRKIMRQIFFVDKELLQELEAKDESDLRR